MVAPVARVVGWDCQLVRRTLANIWSDEVPDHTCFHATELRTDPGHAVVFSGKDGKVLPSVMCSPALFSWRASTRHSSLQGLLVLKEKLAVFIEMWKYCPRLTEEILTQFCEVFWPFCVYSKCICIFFFVVKSVFLILNFSYFLWALCFIWSSLRY